MLRRLIAFLLCFLVGSPFAFACPCGCGSSDFLYLETGENFKYRVLYAHELAPLYYDRAGKSYSLGGDTAEIETIGLTSVFSVGKKFSLGVQLDFKKNIGKQNVRYGVGDPSLHFLASVFEKDLFDTFHLSLKSGFSVKFPVASSGSDSDQLLIFSSGHWDVSPNFSASLQYAHWTLLAKEIMTLRIHKSENISPDFVNRLSLGISYTFFGLGQLGVSLDEELRWQELSSARGLSRYTHKLNWNLTARVGDRKSLGLNFSHPVLVQKNAPIYKEVGISFSHAL